MENDPWHDEASTVRNKSLLVDSVLETSGSSLSLAVTSVSSVNRAPDSSTKFTVTAREPASMVVLNVKGTGPVVSSLKTIGKVTAEKETLLDPSEKVKGSTQADVLSMTGSIERVR
jgi:hypothetical protein